MDAVAVKINGGTAVPLTREDGHPDPADTTWVGTVPGAKAGDKYRYAIQRGGVTREFNDPRTRQLTGFEQSYVMLAGGPYAGVHRAYFQYDGDLRDAHRYVQ